MSKAKPIPPEVVDYLDYNPENGILTWKKKTSIYSAIKINQEAGCKRKRTTGDCHEVIIVFNQKFYKAHRIAYFIYHGVDPKEKQVDHIDGNPLNNKIDNLRLVTNNQNQFNKSFKKNNTSGVVGVCWHKSNKKWRARIYHKNKEISLGYFDDIEEAKAVRVVAEKKYFGKHRNNCNDNA